MSSMQIGFRFRCYPTAQQEQTLLRWVGCQRFIYNAKVGEDRYFRTFARKSLQHAGQFAPIDQQYSHFITESTPWLREVPSVVLRNAATRWKQAYSRYFSKLGGRPTIKKRDRSSSVWLTSELFQFVPHADAATGEITHRLFVGTKKFPLGEICFVAHRGFKIPASITLSIKAGRWFVSGTHDDATAQPTFEETADWLQTFGRDELMARTLGVDRGVAIPAMASNGVPFDISDVQKARIAKKQAAAKRWQRKLSRRAKGSANREKAKRRIDRLRQYARDVRRDFAHKASHAIVSDPRAAMIVFEDLGVQRMTRRARPKQDASGRWMRNNAAAKSGLNAGILASSWGRIKQFSVYKALRAGKLCLDVPAHHTSQECAACGHTHPENRTTQALFLCQRCGHQDNADANASKVIARRGVDLVRSGQYRDKDRKRTMRLRPKQQLGPERSEVTPGESRVSHGTGNGAALLTQNQETHPTTLCV